MRLAGKAKAGFYPTPPRVVELIAGHLLPQPGVSVLDPCAGEGAALSRLARAVKGSPVAIELSKERARACRGLGLPTLQGDSLAWRGEGFGLLLLNPPYDDGAGERLERTFLRHWTPALAPGGVLVFIVPERVLDKTADHLTAWYDRLLALRFPQPEYERFRQAVVFGARRPEPGPAGRLEVLGTLGEVRGVYGLPLTAGRLEGEALSPQAVRELAEKSPLWAGLGRRSPTRFKPLLPLKKAHLALLLAGGLLNNQVVRVEGEPYLLRGQVRKRVVREGLEEGLSAEREQFAVSIAALGLRNGELVEIE